MPRRFSLALTLIPWLCGSAAAATPGPLLLEDLLQTAARYMEEGRVDEAIAIGRQAASLFPEAAMAHRRLGEALSLRAQYKKWEVLEDPYPSMRSPDVEDLAGDGGAEERAAFSRAFYLEPPLFCEQGCASPWRWSFPVAEIRAVLDRHPRSVCARHYLAKELNEQERLEESATTYRELLELDPDRTCARREFAWLYFLQGREAEAEEILRPLRELEMEDVQLLEEIAKRLQSKHNPGRAAAIFRRLADLHRSSLANARRWRWHYLENERYDDALSMLEYELDYWFELARVYESLGHSLGQHGLHREARTIYLRRIALQSKPAEALAEVEARLAPESPDWVRLEEQRRSLDYLPSLASTYCGLALQLEALREGEAAAGALRQAIEIDPDDRFSRSRLGWVLLRLDRPEEAAAVFRRALTLHPERALPHRDLGVALADLQRFDEAAAELRAALEMYPEAGAAHWHLARVLFHQGKEDEAVSACRRAIALEPWDRRPYRLLAWLLARQGRLEEALGAYRQAIALAPDFAPTRNELGWVLLRHGRVEEAVEQYALAAKSVLQDTAGGLLARLRGRGPNG